jgi:hypothetical protein
MWECRDDWRIMEGKSRTARRTCPSIRHKRRIITGKIVQHLEKVVNSNGVCFLYCTISITQCIDWESWKLELSVRFVDIVIGSWTGRSWVRISAGKRIFIFSERAIPALGSNQPLIPREPAFSSGGNAAGAWIWPLTTFQSRDWEWMETSFIPPTFNCGVDMQTLF